MQGSRRKLRKDRSKEKSLNQFLQKPGVRERKYILIVCEGKKTEPCYFRLMRKELRLRSAVIDIEGEKCGSAPISVVEHALDLKRKAVQEAKRNSSLSKYDEIWCVIDVEAPIPHHSLNDAWNLAEGNKIRLILSNPCFEYWLLLHFKKTDAPVQQSSDLENKLKDYIPNYRPGDRDTFSKVYDRRGQAIENAKQLEHEKGWGEDLRKQNPSTHVHKIVEKLLNIG